MAVLVLLVIRVSGEVGLHVVCEAMCSLLSVPFLLLASLCSQDFAVHSMIGSAGLTPVPSLGEYS
jgi:hypothetical protein